MTIASLLVCSDEASVQVLRSVLEDLGIPVELCADAGRAALRLAQDHFDLVILDCAAQSDVIELLQQIRSSPRSDTSLAVVVAGGQETFSIREMFSLGVKFVLYRPVSYERALSSLCAAQAVLYRDKRQKPRATVHAHATIDYAGVEQARGTLVDLAEGGIGINFGEKLPPTCKVYFQFQLPGQKADVRLSGQVAWQDWKGRAGIQFADVPQGSRKVLREWLQMNLADAPKFESPFHEGDALAAAEMRAASRPRPEPVVAHKLEVGEVRVEEEDAAGKRKEPSVVAIHHVEHGERRGETRYACHLGAEVYQRGSTVKNYCNLSDLSPGGCYLEMPLVLPVGTAVEIIVRTHEMKLHVSGDVRASHPGYGISVAMNLNTKKERDGVQQLIDFVAAAAQSSS
jgi:CheY-like chemotaxis protein